METQPVIETFTDSQHVTFINNQPVTVTDTQPVTVNDNQPVTATHTQPVTVTFNQPVTITNTQHGIVNDIDTSTSSNYIHSHRSYAKITKSISQNICPTSSRYASKPCAKIYLKHVP
jgi:hypothetical protein